MVTAIVGANWGDEGKGKDLLQQPCNKRHGHKHTEKDQHVGGHGAPAGVCDERQVG